MAFYEATLFENAQFKYFKKSSDFSTLRNW